MLYINTKETAPVVYIPLNGYPYGYPFMEGCVVLVATNTTDKREVRISPKTASPWGFLVRLSLELPDGFGPGEWEYKFQADGITYATGLLVAYDGDKEGAVEYSSELNVIQYE